MTEHNNCAKRYLRWWPFRNTLFVCLCVCHRFFGVSCSNISTCFTHMPTDVLTQGSVFAVLTKNETVSNRVTGKQLRIGGPVNGSFYLKTTSFKFKSSSGKQLRIGGPKNCSFWPESDQFQIELPVNSSGLGVPKTINFSSNPSLPHIIADAGIPRLFSTLRAPALQSVI